MVVEPFFSVPKAVHNSGHGVSTRETIAVGDPTNSVVGHHFFNQFEVEPCMPLFERFGLADYGCCAPLDLKMEQVRRIRTSAR
jgi:hypothetical protein